MTHGIVIMIQIGGVEVGKMADEKKSLDKVVEEKRYPDFSAWDGSLRIDLGLMADNLRAAARKVVSDWGSNGYETARMYEDQARAFEIALEDRIYKD